MALNNITLSRSQESVLATNAVLRKTYLLLSLIVQRFYRVVSYVDKCASIKSLDYPDRLLRTFIYNFSPKKQSAWLTCHICIHGFYGL